MRKTTKVYPAVIAEMENWPINQHSRRRQAFIEELDDFVFSNFSNFAPQQLNDIIIKTIYLEQIRIKEEPWKVDPPNEGLFWRKIRNKLLKKSLDKELSEANAANEEILQTIIHRYSEEIVGTFNKNTFHFSRRFLKAFFNRLLNTAASRNLKRIYSDRHQMQDRFKIYGNIDTIRSLFDKGTVVVLPTHFSNLDSILLGYAMDFILGLPSFTYGAGLNLYNTGYTAYFMNRLGAYRVDRRKKNPIYLEVLKATSNLSMQQGVNNLFFPGGTRSRVGSLEKKLKLGLLSTAVDAQRILSSQNSDKKIFIVPLVTSYHFVLEAPFLIEQHLRRTGKEKYIKTRDASSSWRKIIKFAWQFFSQSSEMTLSFSQPMDVMGNVVDAEGVSYDQFGRPVDVKDYFTSNGLVKVDPQRDSEYTQLLANKLVKCYHADNIVLSSHVVAFVAFNLLKAKRSNLDLYGILRLPTDEYYFEINTIVEAIHEIQVILKKMAEEGNLKLSPEISWDAIDLIKNGVNRMGNYHAQRPLVFNKKGHLVSENFKVLYFYHNRLDNYGLDKKIHWGKYH